MSTSVERDQIEAALDDPVHCVLNGVDEPKYRPVGGADHDCPLTVADGRWQMADARVDAGHSTQKRQLARSLNCVYFEKRSFSSSGA
jgi:hypothetical protein